MQELLTYKDRITVILESFTDGYLEVDKDWTVTYWNGKAEELLMMPRTEILGKNLWEVYQDAISLKFYTAYREAVDKQISVRFEEYFPAKQLWFEVAAFPSGNGLSVYFKDITSRKQATQQLELEKEKYRDLFNRSPFPQWVYDLDTLGFLDVNEAAIKHYGYSRAEFLKLTLMDIRPDTDRSVLADILNSKVREGHANRAIVQHTKKNGEVIHVTVEGNSIAFEGCNARMVTIIDRTAELKAEQVIQNMMDRYAIVSKATSDAIWDWDMTNGTVVWNQGIRGIFGYRQTTFDEAWKTSRIHEDDRERVTALHTQTMLTGGNRINTEYRFLCADGSYRTVQDRAFIVFDAAGKATRIIGSMQDITERVGHLEKIERQHAKLHEISWIQAHKVRAPLSNLMGLVSLLQDLHSENEETQKILDLLASSAEELDNVVRAIAAKP